MIETVIGAIAANAVILAALGFLTRSIIIHFLSKDIEKFKNDLEFKAKIELESYRSKLEKEHIRLQISYGGIFEKQANVFIEIYNHILTFEAKIKRCITPLGKPEIAYQEFIEAYQILFSYYERNRILLPKTFEESFEAFTKKLYNAIESKKIIDEQLNRRELLEQLNMLSKENIAGLYQRQDKAYEILDNLPEFRNILTEKLRSLIGINFGEKDL